MERAKSIPWPAPLGLYERLHLFHDGIYLGSVTVLGLVGAGDQAIIGGVRAEDLWRGTQFYLYVLLYSNISMQFPVVVR